MKNIRIILLCCACALAAAQNHSADHQCPMLERGDQAMGFSHQNTTHHFRIAKNGGAVEVEANDPSDQATRALIRTHLEHLAKMFAAGDFNTPMFIHDRTPPGSDVMKRLKNSIEYSYQPTAKGARVTIATDNEEARSAIYEFLRFQIAEHKTGDPLNP